ncbi:MAG: acetyltransferase [Candidatus Dojkabacteria bacterium]|nr:acetyltransferase [Candidatus Dojkabacteria bacterium]
MAKIIIFGSGDIAQIAKYYFDIDSPHEVIAFTLDKEYIKESLFEGLPVIPFEQIEQFFPPSEYQMFIAISYRDMNRLRQKKFFEAKSKGYHLVSYISSKSTYLSQYKCGENCFIFEDNTIQPFVKIEDNVTIWSGNHIGHHSIIHSHNFISSHVVISGHCEIEPNCFLGVNSTIAHWVKIAKGTLVGAGATITKNTEPDSVYVPAKSIKLDKKSFEIKL